MQAELGADARVLATGGLAGLITPHAETVDEHVPDLTLEGLRLVYELQKA
jgi:type III pantothenate kinase